MNDTLRHFTHDGVRIAADVQGEGPTVLLLHGFPQTSYCWRHQVAPLTAAGYRVVRPDLRGFGRSDVPHDVDSYRMDRVVGDVIAVIDGLGLDQAVVVGHDWGASLAWSSAALHPERIAAVIGLSVPFARRSSAPPIQRLVEKAGGYFFYMDYFQQPGVAEAELESDPRGLMRALLFTASGDGSYGAPRSREEGRFGDQLTNPDVLPPWLTEADVDVYTAAFAATGWTGALNWYRAMDPSWHACPTIGTQPLPMPAGFLAGERDMVLAFTPSKHLSDLLPDLRELQLLPGIGHWVQEEAPQATTDFLLRVLGALERWK